MAILSVDTYLQNEIESKLKSLLSNPYIIREEILKDFEPDIRDSFINSYCYIDGKQKTNIPVVFAFNPNKMNANATILIQFKGAQEPEEKDGAIGMDTGYTSDAEGTFTKEKTEITVEQNPETNEVTKCYFTVSQPIYSLNNIPELSIDMSKYHIEGNRIYLPYRPTYKDDMKVTVWYTPIDTDTEGNQRKDNVGRALGYGLNEVYTIDTVSNNIDTLRCLDATLRAILIFMRQNKNEQVEYRLQSLTFKGADLLNEINNNQNSAFNNQLYYRRVEVGYTTNNTLNNTLGYKIDKILLNNE